MGAEDESGGSMCVPCVWIPPLDQRRQLMQILFRRMLQPTEVNLHKFEQWMCRRGRQQDSARQYAGKVTLCFGDRRGVTARLTSDGLAPLSRRQNLAALRAWAKYSKDGQLRDRLDDIKLPPPERVLEKLPLTFDEWAALIEALGRVKLEPHLHACVEMICIRGFRVGDVVRIGRQPIQQALRTGRLIYRAKGDRRLNWPSAPFRHCLELFAESKRWRSVCDLVTPRSREDRRWKAARLKVQRAFPVVVAEAGLDEGSVSPHRLRRTYATHYLAQVDGRADKLQKHMGWASLQTAMMYVDHDQGDELEQEAAEMRLRIHG